MKRKNSAKDQSVIISALIGVGVCAISMILMSALGAWLVGSERLDIGAMDWLSVIIHIVSAFAGTWVALSAGKQKLAIITGITTGGTSIILICCAMLFWGGELGSVLTGILSIGAGGIAACMMKLKIGEGARKRKKKAFR